ncbi:tetratricopeptide repeat protein [Micromonospora echinospora]|uniref:tetratricopeptide repeat protein n=1 Tax=Micromonospora echinospora TaxID=1877 RepID=UPI003B8A9AEF
MLGQLEDHHGEAQAWNNCGTALQQVRRLDEAITAHSTARDIYRRLGKRHGEGTAQSNLGIALAQVRRFDEARSCWRQAVEAFIETGDAQSAKRVQAILDILGP